MSQGTTDSKDRICPEGRHAARRDPSCDSSGERDEAQIQKRVRRATTSRKRSAARLKVRVAVLSCTSSPSRGSHRSGWSSAWGGRKPHEVRRPGCPPDGAYRHLGGGHLWCAVWQMCGRIIRGIRRVRVLTRMSRLCPAGSPEGRCDVLRPADGPGWFAADVPQVRRLGAAGRGPVSTREAAGAAPPVS